jgi:mono/diheme cytochrome c family protein
MRAVRNALMVLALSASLAVMLYSGVEISSAVSGGQSSSSTARAGQTYLCPVTGCSATSCHGANGQPAPSASASAGNGSATGSDSSGVSQTMTCPRTGCTAATCHGANGQLPPSSGGGYSRGYGRGYSGGGQDYSSRSQGGIVSQ